MFDPVTNIGLLLSGLSLFVAGLQWVRLPRGKNGAQEVSFRHIELAASALGMGLVLLGLSLMWLILFRHVF